MVWDCYIKWGSLLQNPHTYKGMGVMYKGYFRGLKGNTVGNHSPGDVFHQGTSRPQPNLEGEF